MSKSKPKSAAERKWCEHITWKPYEKKWWVFRGWCAVESSWLYCPVCGAVRPTRDNPTKLKQEVKRLFEMVNRLGRALHEQDERWGLYESYSKEALKAFKKMKAPKTES